MNHRKSPYFFGEITFGENVVFLSDPREVLSEIDLVLLIVPNQFIAPTLLEYKNDFKDGVIFLNLSKGINNTTLETVSDTIAHLHLP